MNRYYDKESSSEVDFDFYENLEPEEKINDGRRSLLGILFIFIDFLLSSHSNSMLKERIIYLAYVLGHPYCRGYSEDDLAFRLGKTRACVSSNILAIQRMLGIPPAPGQKSIESRRAYHNVPRGTNSKK